MLSIFDIELAHLEGVLHKLQKFRMGPRDEKWASVFNAQQLERSMKCDWAANVRPIGGNE
jgi:hypothetical protein